MKRLCISCRISAWRPGSGCPRGAAIELRKAIPAQAGLAGGSSDAAATLHGYARVFAPFDGVVVSRNADPGKFVANATTGATINAALVTGLNDPFGFAVSGGDIFVVNDATGVVSEYTTSGATVNASLISWTTSPR